jgi:hypothetical protein
MGRGVFAVKNFEKFQHYRDRAPVWIKLHVSLLDDYEFNQLPKARQRDLIFIWLKMSQKKNRRLPFDPAWIAQSIHSAEPVDLESLAAAGYLVVDPPDDAAPAPQPEAPQLDLFGAVEQIDPAASANVKDAEQPSTSNSSALSDHSSSPDPDPDQDAMFDQFYEQYPRHIGRQKAHASWKALTGEEKEAALADLPRRKAAWDKAGTDHQFIPHPTTWLNQRRWTDELPRPPQPRAKEVFSGNSPKTQWLLDEIARFEEQEHERSGGAKTDAALPRMLAGPTGRQRDRGGVGVGARPGELQRRSAGGGRASPGRFCEADTWGNLLRDI